MWQPLASWPTEMTVFAMVSTALLTRVGELH